MSSILGPYQEDDRDVEEESAEAVEEECEQADVVDFLHGAFGYLPEEGNDEVHDGANWGEVVQGHEWVHLVIGTVQDALNQVESEGFKNNAADLVDKPDPDKLDLADRGNDNANDDNRDVKEPLEVRAREP